MKTTADQLAAADQAVAAIKPRLEPLAARVAALLADAKAADAKARTDRVALLALTAHIDDAKALVAFSHTTAAVDSSRAAVAKADADLATAREAVTDFQPQTDRASQALATTTEQAAQRSAALAEAQKQQAERKSTADAVTEALAKTEIALKKLPESAELAVAVQSLQKKNACLAAELKSHETLLAEREAAAKAAGEAVAKAQQNVGNAAAQRDTLSKQVASLEQAAAGAARCGYSNRYVRSVAPQSDRTLDGPLRRRHAQASHARTTRLEHDAGLGRDRPRVR